MSRKPGDKTYLYSVWRNSDDRLLILDGTAEQCAKVMGIKLDTFWRFTTNKHGTAYTVQKIRRDDAKREEEE